MSDLDAMPIDSSQRGAISCETPPYPDVPLLVSRTAAVRSFVAKKKLAA
jgi:hypothetical protein